MSSHSVKNFLVQKKTVTKHIFQRKKMFIVNYPVKSPHGEGCAYIKLKQIKAMQTGKQRT